MTEQNIRQFYSKKNIFITGGTGFVGICLVEKLLRTIPDIGTIYLLIRPKKGKDIQSRLNDLKDISVFDKLKEDLKSEEFQRLFSKCKAVAGDVGEKNLGLSPEDRQLLCNEVNVVFHSAATLDFEETLRTTVRINLLGTRQIAELCSQMKNLAVLVHVSSAYVNSYLLHAEEKIYPLMEDTEKIIKICEEVKDDQQLIDMTPKLLGTHPNTYTFTKHMAEHEVQKFESKYPVTIVRPSMICGAWKEPVSGWTISKNGPQGFVMGALMGVVRRLPMSTSVICDYIPVDIVINTLLTAGVHVATTKPGRVEVFQATSSVRKPFRWNMVEDKINGYLHRYPSKGAVWYPHLKLLPSYTWFRISSLFVHLFPAFILDGILQITGGRPKLRRLHSNINRSLALLHTFIFTQWTYPADRTEELHKWLSLEDRKAYGVSLDTLDWRDFFIFMCQGVRRYLCKESDKSLQAARNKDTFLFGLHLILQALLYGGVWYMSACLFSTTMSKTAVILPFIYFLFSVV